MLGLSSCSARQIASGVCAESGTLCASSCVVLAPLCASLKKETNFLGLSCYLFHTFSKAGATTREPVAFAYRELFLLTGILLPSDQ